MLCPVTFHTPKATVSRPLPPKLKPDCPGCAAYPADGDTPPLGLGQCVVTHRRRPLENAPLIAGVNAKSFGWLRQR